MAAVSMESQDFLVSCLQVALRDAAEDLVKDVADAAFICGLNAAVIGNGNFSVASAKELLFLTEQEAISVISICQKMVRAGLKDARAVSLKINTTPSGDLTLSINAITPEPDMEHPADSSLMLAALMSSDAADSSEHEEPHQQPHPVNLPLQAVPEDEEMAPASAAATADSSIPEPVPSDEPATVIISRTTLSKKPAPLLPELLPSPEPAASPSALRAAKTPSTPPAARATRRPLSASVNSLRTTGLSKSMMLPSTASMLTPTREPSSVPSYLRPTEASKHRKGAADSPDSGSPRPGASWGGCADLSVSASFNKGSSSKGPISRLSTLLAPTAAYVARLSDKAADDKKKKESPLSKSTVMLESVLASPQGQRVTKAQPFAFKTEYRPKGEAQTTEEKIMAEAAANAFKRHVVPKFVHEQRPLEFRAASKPKDPQELFQPFQLASLSRHQQQLELLRKKAEEEKAAEEGARVFKARQFSAKVAAGAQVPPKPEPTPVTRGSAPVFASEARIAHHREVLEPAKRAKEEEKNKEQLEAERKAKELEELSVEEFRKTLEFKARVMPDFSAPFSPDRSLAKPVTLACEPVFNTDKRLGKAVTPGTREDLEGHRLGNGCYDVCGYVDPFKASLRRSTSVAPGSAPAKLRSSSSAARVGGQGGLSLSVSVGSELHAAIRAAAAQAQREAKEAAATTPTTCAQHSRRTTTDSIGVTIASPAMVAI